MRVLLNIWNLPDLRRKIIFTLFIIVIFRVVAHIPLPGADVNALKDFFSSSQLFQLLDLFSGGTLFNFSILTLGLNPYINASIIMQLLVNVVPKLEELQKEGEYGRRKINQYTRYLTMPLAFVQSWGILILFRRSGSGLLSGLSPIELIAVIVTMTAGTIFLMWLGELITEHGITNGISVLIFSGILARLPITLGQTATIFNAENALNIILIIVFALVVIIGIVVISEAHRRVVVQYARRVRGGRDYGGGSTHLPIKINQAGVIPIIFAVSIILLPGMLATFFATASNPVVADIAATVRDFFNNPLYYSSIYFTLVVVFTFFYIAMTFQPNKIADDLRKYGGFIPGIRPGVATSNYLGFIINRITLVGGIFLGLVAILPFITSEITNISTIAIGGTGLLIVVSVVIEAAKQVESQLIMRSYEGFLR